MINVAKSCCLALLIQLAASTCVLAAPSTYVVGSCFVIHLRDGVGTAPDVTQFCRSVEQQGTTNGEQFGRLYGWVTPFLAEAFDEAERAVSDEPGAPGHLTGISGNRYVRVILVPGGLEAANTIVSSTTIDIFVSSGFIDFAQGISGAAMLDIFAERGFPNNVRVEGVGFRSWLRAARSNTTLPNGNLAFPGPRAIPSAEWGIKYVQTPASSVYRFLFSHELSHIKMGLSSGGVGDEIVRREMDVDRFAFRKLALSRTVMPDGTSVEGTIIPSFIVDWLIAMRYYEKINAIPLSNAARAELQRLSSMRVQAQSFDQLFPARDWIRRATGVADEWERICARGSKGVLCGPGWRSAVDEARKLVNSPTPGDP